MGRARGKKERLDILRTLMEFLVRDSARARDMLEQDPTLLHERVLWGETLLHFMAVENEEQAVQLLISLGVDVNAANDYQDTPLLSAVTLGYTAIVRLLLGAGADLNKCNGLDDFPITKAVSNGDVEMVEILLRAGASPVDSPDFQDSLEFALEYCDANRESITALLRGANRGFVV